MVDGQSELDDWRYGQVRTSAERISKSAAGDPVVVGGVFSADQPMEKCLDANAAERDSRTGQERRRARNQGVCSDAVMSHVTLDAEEATRADVQRGLPSI